MFCARLSLILISDHVQDFWEVEAGVVAELFNGEELVRGLVEGFHDAAEEIPTVAVGATGDFHYIFRVDAESFLSCFHTLSMLYPLPCHKASLLIPQM